MRRAQSPFSTRLLNRAGDIRSFLWRMKGRGFGPAADAIMLPQAKPWTVRERLVMSSIGGGDISQTKGPSVRHEKHAFQLLDIRYNAFNIHRDQYSEESLSPSSSLKSPTNPELA